LKNYYDSDFIEDISHKLCEEIAEISKGVCLLGFSRGKDSIAAYIRLKYYFKTIIPFHLCSVPHLSFVDDSLNYYEKILETKIERCVNGEITKAIGTLIYQPIEDEDNIDQLNLWAYDTHKVVELIKRKYNLPLDTWTAFGINASDSIDRHIYVNKYKGKIDSRKSFYPCYNWKKKQIIDYINKYNIKLPKDYLLSNRTLAGLPSYRHLEKINEIFPEDMEKIECVFPFIKAQMARNEFRKNNINQEVV